jgi:1-deoxy-D-xylulose-5-phosphate reductoisomerase
VPRRLAILGSTGSIGRQALDVVSRSTDQGLRVVALSAASGWEQLIEQARAYSVKRIALSNPDAAARASEAWTEGEVLSGPEGLVKLITECECDLVLNAIVGSAGLVPTVATLGEGIDLALANKESLVVGGELVTQLAEATGAAIIPVDSEHSAVHQLLASEQVGTVDKIVLTASGGPFRGRSASELTEVTIEQALAHPTWAMGGKITIDSATLMNKGLEVIEAHWLFGVRADQIDVVIHPQSVVHSMVELTDGSILAQLGVTDMRLPIQYAFSYPERWQAPVPPLDLARAGRLDFEVPDTEAFPCLRLAYRALEAERSLPVVLNAANEIAVARFLDGRLGFTSIAHVIERTMLAHTPVEVHTLAIVRAVDRWARDHAADVARGLELKV